MTEMVSVEEAKQIQQAIKAPPKEPVGFVHMLRSLDDGNVEGDCSASLKMLVQDLQAYAAHFGKAKGTLDLRLSLLVEADGTAEIRGEVKTKAPKRLRPKTSTWILKDGSLSTKNPKQLEFGALKSVEIKPVRRELDHE